MKYLVTRRRIYFAEVEANNENEALSKAEVLLEEDWGDDDRPDEFSIECDPVEDNEEDCPYCHGNGYVIIHGREETPETCPRCDGTGKR